MIVLTVVERRDVCFTPGFNPVVVHTNRSRLDYWSKYLCIPLIIMSRINRSRRLTEYSRDSCTEIAPRRPLTADR